MKQHKSPIAIWLLVVALVGEAALLVFAKLGVPILALIHVAAFSAVAFVAFAWDKIQARNGGRRVSEATLLGMSVLGGALGGIGAMLATRHKTTRALFWIVECGSLFIHVTLVGWLFISR